MKKLLIGILALVACSFSFALKLDGIVAFGDSLSDDGNLYYFTSQLSQTNSFVPAIPTSPEYHEGRFSDGEVWVEYLAKRLFNSKTKLYDYAFGGAWMENHRYSREWYPPDLPMQVDSYLIQHQSDTKKSNYLYAIWGGANDYLGGRDNSESATENTVSVIKKEIVKLITQGKAKYFLILNLPNLGETPYGHSYDALFTQSLTDITLSHNQKLQVMINELKKTYPKVKFMTLDIFGNLKILQETQMLDGVSFAIIDQPCYTGTYYPLEESQTYLICSNAEDYLFWDHLHPTTRVHERIASQAYNLIHKNGLY